MNTVGTLLTGQSIICMYDAHLGVAYLVASQISERKEVLVFIKVCSKSLKCSFFRNTRLMVLGHSSCGCIVEQSFYFGTSVRRSSGRRSGVAVRAVDCWQRRSGH